MNDNVALIESTSKGRLLPDFKISEELSDMIVSRVGNLIEQEKAKTRIVYCEGLYTVEKISGQEWKILTQSIKYH